MRLDAVNSRPKQAAHADDSGEWLFSTLLAAVPAEDRRAVLSSLHALAVNGAIERTENNHNPNVVNRV